MLVGTLLFSPLPLSNVPPALVIILLSFAYLEEDGVLLCIALATALVVFMIAAGTIWQAISAAG
jgi:hypothetical protein